MPYLLPNSSLSPLECTFLKYNVVLLKICQVFMPPPNIDSQGAERVCYRLPFYPPGSNLMQNPWSDICGMIAESDLRGMLRGSLRATSRGKPGYANIKPIEQSYASFGISFRNFLCSGKFELQTLRGIGRGRLYF